MRIHSGWRSGLFAMAAYAAFIVPFYARDYVFKEIWGRVVSLWVPGHVCSSGVYFAAESLVVLVFVCGQLVRSGETIGGDARGDGIVSNGGRRCVGCVCVGVGDRSGVLVVLCGRAASDECLCWAGAEMGLVAVSIEAGLGVLRMRVRHARAAGCAVSGVWVGAG